MESRAGKNQINYFLERTITFWSKIKLDDSDYVWNFAYGSNMHPATLRKRGRIKVLESQPGILFDWRLTFNLPGIMFVEPSMASIKSSSGSQVHGVLLKLDRASFQRLILSEGGGIYYEIIQCPIQAYDGRIIEAFIFKAQANLVVNYDIPPSQRYLNLIKRGAKINNLDPKYQADLSNLSHDEVLWLATILGNYFFARISELSWMSWLDYFLKFFLVK